MEEDIKILEELKEDETLDCSGIYKRLSEREQQAIENIIQGYKDQKCKADIQDATIKNMQDFMEQDKKAIRELKEDLKYVLDQTLGAFENNWCIDWNFTDIREKYNLGDE